MILFQRAMYLFRNTDISQLTMELCSNKPTRSKIDWIHLAYWTSWLSNTIYCREPVVSPHDHTPDGAFRGLVQPIVSTRKYYNPKFEVWLLLNVCWPTPQGSQKYCSSSHCKSGTSALIYQIVLQPGIATFSPWDVRESLLNGVSRQTTVHLRDTDRLFCQVDFILHPSSYVEYRLDA